MYKNKSRLLKVIRNCLFVRGHFGYNEFLIKDRYVFTMLRNPIERVISQSLHIVNDKINNGWYPIETTKNFSTLEKCLNDDRFMLKISNLQIKYLSSFFNPLNKRFIKDNFYFDNNKKFYFLINPVKGLLISIKRLFFDINFYGITEWADESMLMLSFYLGQKPVLLNQRYMVSSRKKDNSDIVKNYLFKLCKLNFFDNVFYLLAKNVFYVRFVLFYKKATGHWITINRYRKKRINYLNNLLSVLDKKIVR